MGVRLVRKPIEGGLPTIYVGGHDLKEFLRVVPPLAARIHATELHIGVRQAKYLAELVVQNRATMPLTLIVGSDPLVTDETSGVLLNTVVGKGESAKVVGYVSGLIPPPLTDAERKQFEKENDPVKFGHGPGKV